MKNMIKDAAVLFVITVFAGLILGFVYQITKEPIAIAEEKAANEAYAEVFPGAASFEKLELAMPVMMEMLERNDHVDVVMALNDPSALGAMAALEQYGMNDAMVYGIDGTPDFKTLIGENPKATGTVAQSPMSIGATAAELMYDRLAGKQIESRVIVPVYLVNFSGFLYIDSNSITT